MKKTLFILLLSITTFTVKAQNMSFDETVKYINDKMATAAQFAKSGITATKDGTVVSSKKTYNLFDLSQTICNDPYVVKQDKGIMLVNKPGYIRVTLSTDGSTLSGMVIYMETEKDAERLYNALVYLRSLCAKKKDPFD
ncbi:hypothetical protein [Mucilaginibacter psychrotolerans]|uniref:DUF4252 domain-containing protein n=1 Tax=Mucilaginibacter psychrotolerans TaxID=1524096 RepID=A0A4Y8S4N9_9SPHI|nr:hypothetical protein [Mucilaginibacter psychrotolerans]TFF33437.1 hypothetical protein E2R66_25850 [Mucilaginibacter psychrotolerans]